MSLVSLVCTFVLVFLSLCAARVLYVESLDEFSKCFLYPNVLSLPESSDISKPYYGVFLRVPTRYEMILEVSLKYPLVKHFQQIGTFFYAICIDYGQFKKHLLTKGGANEELIEKKESASRFRRDSFCIKQTISDLYVFRHSIEEKQKSIELLSDQLFILTFDKASFDLSSDEAVEAWMAGIFKAAKKTYKLLRIHNFVREQYSISIYFPITYNTESEQIIALAVKGWSKLVYHMCSLVSSFNYNTCVNAVDYNIIWSLFNESQFITTIAISLNFFLENLSICHKAFPNSKDIYQIAKILKENKTEFFEKFKRNNLFDYALGDESIDALIAMINKPSTSQRNKELTDTLSQKITELKIKETRLQDIFIRFIRALTSAIIDTSNWTNNFRGEEGIPIDAIQMIMDTYFDIHQNISYSGWFNSILEVPIDVQVNSNGILVGICNSKSHLLFYHYYLLHQVFSEFSKSVVIPIQNLVIKKTNSSNADSIFYLANIIKDDSFVRTELKDASAFLSLQTKSNVSADDANEIENSKQASIDSSSQTKQLDHMITENPNQPTTRGLNTNGNSLKRKSPPTTDYNSLKRKSVIITNNSTNSFPSHLPPANTPTDNDDDLIDYNDIEKLFSSFW